MNLSGVNHRFFERFTAIVFPKTALMLKSLVDPRMLCAQRLQGPRRRVSPLPDFRVHLETLAQLRFRPPREEGLRPRRYSIELVERHHEL